ncbi:hypothetical protein BGZ58_000181 [Dissophora ornata]|nr:hypothetical protein BGZ58_000181 [Dissophora ornata]
MTSNQLTPFCFATDGNSVYATAYAYDANEIYPISDYPNWLVLLKASTLLQQSGNTNTDPQSLSWSVVNAVPRTSVNLLPGVIYRVSCGVSAKAGVFVLHVQGPHFGSAFSIRMLTKIPVTEGSTYYGAGNVQLLPDEFSSHVDQTWSPDYNAPLFSLMDIAWPTGVSNNTKTNTTMTTTLGVNQSSNSSTEWVQATVSSSDFSLATSVNKVFPITPQSSSNTFWNSSAFIPYNAAAAYDNNTIYMVSGNATDSFITSIPIVLQSDMTTINGTLGHRYKIPGSVSCDGLATMIAAKNRYVHVICQDLSANPALRVSWDITTNLEPIVTSLQVTKSGSGSVKSGRWPSNIALNMAPLYTNDTGYAESFVFCDSDNSYSINSAGDMRVYAITNFGSNFTSINPNYEAPPKLSVSTIILIVIGAIAVAVGLFFARRWFIVREILDNPDLKLVPGFVGDTALFHTQGFQ